MMNIKKFISILLIANLTIINISGMERKRRAVDDSNLDSQRIKLDPDFLAELAKAKVLAEKSKEDKSKEKAQDPAQKDLLAKKEAGDEKESVNLNFIKMPQVLQDLIAQYLKDDWYLYDKCELDRAVEQLSFSDNSLLLIRSVSEKENWFSIYDVIQKKFTGNKFDLSQGLYNYITKKKKYIDDKDMRVREKGEYYSIGVTNVPADFLDAIGILSHETYLSKDILLNSLFCLSKCEKYLAVANKNFFKIWYFGNRSQEGISEGRNIITEKNCIISYKIREDKKQDNELKDDFEKVKLVFSGCSSYLIIAGTFYQHNFCYICNLRTKVIMNFINDLDIEHDDYYPAIAFSQNSKYLAIGAGRNIYGNNAYIFKNRQNGFE